MVSPLQTNDNKVVTALADFVPRCDIHPELLLKLQGRLQTTLDIEKLLSIFFEEIQASVQVDGIQYARPQSADLFNLGKKSKHEIHYTLQTQKDEMGELVFYRNTRFREQELANLEGLLTALVYPLRNSLHYLEALEASFKDTLTGAHNRAAMQQIITREMELSKRHKRSLAILMLDIDHFKSINDNYGHCMGDKVIKDVVESITLSTRQTDICFRYGGEEFLVMLNNTHLKDVLKISERIRQHIAQKRFVFEQQSFRITASIGFTHLQPSDTLESFIHRADKGLYLAKYNGRNQVIGA